MTEMQQSKYHDLQAGLPSELSMQLAEVTLALGSAEDQVRHHKSPFHPQILREECECCAHTLAELAVAVQEFGEQNPLLCKQLGDVVAKMAEAQRHVTQQVQDRSNRLKRQAEKQLADYQSVKEFILSWVEKAESLLSGSVVWSPISQLQEQIRAYQVSLNYFYWIKKN
uniref:Uncharacterized protein n=1 Tax=Hippocampus comes TaxID=109280 RepID=A0A3Q3E087_HIPCM